VLQLLIMRLCVRLEKEALCILVVLSRITALVLESSSVVQSVELRPTRSEAILTRYIAMSSRVC